MLQILYKSLTCPIVLFVPGHVSFSDAARGSPKRG